MIELLRQRRSIRTYQTQSIEPDKIDILVEAALRAPTSRNIRPWEFIFVSEPQTIKKLALAKQSGSTFLAGAPLAIVVAGDETKSDVWIEDCSIASIILQLTAQSLGLGSCWAQIRNRRHSEKLSAGEYIQKLMGLAPNLKIESIIGVGYPAETKEGISAARLNRDKIHLNSF